jgi:hypothetical protein
MLSLNKVATTLPPKTPRDPKVINPLLHDFCDTIRDVQSVYPIEPENFLYYVLWGPGTGAPQEEKK